MTPGEPRTAAGQALLHHIRKSDQGYPTPGTTIPELIRTIEDEARAGSLDAAWEDAEAALHARADWWRIRSMTEIAFAPMRWEVVATDGNRIVRAEGHDPAAALRALAAALREAQPYVHDAPCPLSGTPHTHEVRRL